MLDDGHAEATLERQQGKLRGESLDLADADLLPRAFRFKEMEVGVIAVLDLPARRARTARPRRWVRIKAQQTGGKVHRKRGLADPIGADQQQRVRRTLGQDAALDEAERSLWPRVRKPPTSGCSALLGRSLGGRLAASRGLLGGRRLVDAVARGRRGRHLRRRLGSRRLGGRRLGRPRTSRLGLWLLSLRARRGGARLGCGRLVGNGRRGRCCLGRPRSTWCLCGRCRGWLVVSGLR